MGFFLAMIGTITAIIWWKLTVGVFSVCYRAGAALAANIADNHGNAPALAVPAAGAIATLITLTTMWPAAALTVAFTIGAITRRTPRDTYVDEPA